MTNRNTPAFHQQLGLTKLEYAAIAIARGLAANDQGYPVGELAEEAVELAHQLCDALRLAR